MFRSTISLGLRYGLLGALVCMPIAYADEDDPVAKAIKARQANFQLYSFYAGPLFAMAKGDQDYDAELASTLANNLNTITHMNTGMMWLPGSDNEARKGKTRAKPGAWAEDSDILEKYETLRTATADLAGVAGDGLDAMRSKIGAVGEGCKGCHDEYRAKEF